MTFEPDNRCIVDCHKCGGSGDGIQTDVDRFDPCWVCGGTGQVEGVNG